jgi:hypothetical protein
MAMNNSAKQLLRMLAGLKVFGVQSAIVNTTTDTDETIRGFFSAATAGHRLR